MQLTTDQRMHWMDILRGFAMILVLAWHAPAIPALVGAELPDWLLAANDALLPYRMPTLMFVSGLLLPAALRKPAGRYYWGKLQLVVWPYLVWSALHILQSDSGEPFFHWRSWVATGYLWFIFFIACYYLVAPLLARLPPWIVPAAALAAALVLPDGLAVRMTYFAFFFFVGAAVSRSPRLLGLIGSTWWVALPAGVVAVGFGVVSAFERHQFEAWTAPFSLCGIVAAIYCARRIEHRRWTRPLRFVGRNSLVFYVAHFPIVLGAWLLVRGALSDSIAVASVLLFVIAIAACSALAVLQRYRPITWLFRAPDVPAMLRRIPPRRTSAAPVGPAPERVPEGDLLP